MWILSLDEFIVGRVLAPEGQSKEKEAGHGSQAGGLSRDMRSLARKQHRVVFRRAEGRLFAEA